MMRCKACDALMTPIDLSRKNRHGEYEEMCGDCIGISSGVSISSKEEIKELDFLVPEATSFEEAKDA